MSKTYKIKITSAVVVNGAPAPAGSIVDVDERLARRMLDAGKAELATVVDVEPDVEPEEETGAADDPAAPVAEGRKKRGAAAKEGKAE